MYSLEQFANMFSDPLRMDAYRGAIAKYVQPGNVVVDLGCGPGVFALLACKAGARRVYAIDLNGVVDFGRHLAAANGVADRVHFLCGDSRQVELPERADVIVSDVRGALPLHAHSIGTIEDARERFLAPGGRLLPSSDTLVCALVENDKAYREICDAWKSLPPLDLSAGLPLALNSMYYEKLDPAHLISDHQGWLKLDYMVGAKAHASVTLQLTVSRDSTGHGIGMWFETQLGDGFGYSTAPGTGFATQGRRLPGDLGRSLRRRQLHLAMGDTGATYGQSSGGAYAAIHVLRRHFLSVVSQKARQRFCAGAYGNRAR
jgi:protein arginine N-methyltransferase 1